MDNCSHKTKKALFTGEILNNTAIGSRFYRLTINITGQPAEIFSKVMPGQFLELDLSAAALPPQELIPPELYSKAHKQIILRRPFSFADIEVISATQIHLTILYCVLGPATLRMTTLTQGEKISIIGPLGNGFSIPKSKKTAILLAGGMGAPPLQHLAAFITKNYPKMSVVAFAGAKTANDLPFVLEDDKLTEFARFNITTHISTDDGSLGFKGFIADLLAKWVENNLQDRDQAVIYACGPEPMLASAAVIADKFKIDCQVSMERMMACGIGLCQSCAVKTKSDQPGETYKLCCKDGPVFNSKEILFD